MVYANYEFYKATYMGTAIKETDFPRMALRASAFLDYYTQGKAAKNAGLDALKMACCALAEQYQLIDTAQELANKSLSAGAETDGTELQSQTVGSWSKSYRSGGDSAASAMAALNTANQRLAEIARQYLAETGLLYRGRCFRCSHTP